MSDIDTLKNVQIFNQLSERALEEIASELKSRKLVEGELLFRQGDPGDDLTIVEVGRNSIFVPVDNVPGGGHLFDSFIGEKSLARWH